MAQGRYMKNRRITVFKGTEKVVDGYTIGYASSDLNTFHEAQTRLPPVNERGTPRHEEGHPEYDDTWVNDQIYATEKRDSPNTH